MQGRLAELVALGLGGLGQLAELRGGLRHEFAQDSPPFTARSPISAVESRAWAMNSESCAAWVSDWAAKVSWSARRAWATPTSPARCSDRPVSTALICSVTPCAGRLQPGDVPGQVVGGRARHVAGLAGGGGQVGGTRGQEASASRSCASARSEASATILA